MSQVVIISFSAEREYEFAVHPTDVVDMDRKAAHKWLADEFEALECTPSNPMGKILVLDMILNVAKYGGEERFRQAGEWARRFAGAVAVALERPAIRVDVPNFVVG